MNFLFRRPSDSLETQRNARTFRYFATLTTKKSEVQPETKIKTLER